MLVKIEVIDGGDAQAVYLNPDNLEAVRSMDGVPGALEGVGAIVVMRGSTWHYPVRESAEEIPGRFDKAKTL
jgi:hypothetical protein